MDHRFVFTIESTADDAGEKYAMVARVNVAGRLALQVADRAQQIWRAA